MRKYSIGVVGHKRRRIAAEQLATKTQAVFLSVDDGTLMCGGNHRHVWRRLTNHPAQWSLVLEDDAILQDGFLEQLDQALDIAPEPIVSLYLGRQRPPQHQQAIQSAIEKADANDAHWITSQRLYHALGVAIRQELVRDMLTWTTKKNYLPIDEAITSWAYTSKLHVAYTWPSLVEHTDGPTITPHRDGRVREPGRVAWRTGTRDTWTDTTTTIPRN